MHIFFGVTVGTGVNPNYGGFGPDRNDAHDSIGAISYNKDYNSNWNQRQQQKHYWYNNNYKNGWQTPNMNNYYNRPYNPYLAVDQGWYGNGGNYGYNKGKPLIPYVWLLIISILISIVCI